MDISVQIVCKTRRRIPTGAGICFSGNQAVVRRTYHVAHRKYFFPWRFERSQDITVFRLLTVHSCHGQQLAEIYVLCCAVLCCAVLCCAVLCCAVLCCAVLCCVANACTASLLHTLSLQATIMSCLCSPFILLAVWCRNPASICAHCFTWSPVRPAHLQAVKLLWFLKSDAVPKA